MSKSNNSRGDTLEVKLCDNDYNAHYRKKINSLNIKDLNLLLDDLRHKGVPIDEALRFKKKLKKPLDEVSWWG